MNQKTHPYNTLSAYYRRLFGGKTYKVCVKAGFTCPNRDGTRATGGCIFCSSQNLTPVTFRAENPINEQVARGIEYLRKKYRAENFIAYFQDFSATYAPIEELRSLYEQALSVDGVVGLSIGTRPDCIDEKTVSLLKQFQERIFVQVELGLQSANRHTLEKINRGHTLEEYVKAHRLCASAGFDVVSHIIVGFPWESRQDNLDTVGLLNELGTGGIKFHALHIIKDTQLCRMYEREKYTLMTLDEYVERMVELLCHTDPDTVIHRVGADTSRQLLVAPDWILPKNRVVQLIESTMRERDLVQGCGLCGGTV